MQQTTYISSTFSEYYTGYCGFAFNGKEKDDEVSGTGNQYDYGFRIYDPLTGKFLSVDPLTKKFPMLTPYQFASNTPIQAIDLDGLESVYANSFFMRSTFGVAIGVIKQEDIDTEVDRNGKMVVGMVEGSIDGVSYFLTSSMSMNGVPSPIAYGFTFQNGFTPELGYYYNITWGNTFRYVGGGLEFVGTVGTIVSTISRSSKYLVRSSRIWGEVIDITEGKTTTILGRNVKGSGLNQVRAKGLHRQGQNTGGYNMLLQDAPDMVDGVKFDWNNSTHRQYYWDNVNQPWLDDAISRGDVIKLADQPTIENMYIDGIESPDNINFFGREVKYLEGKGYTFKNGNAMPPSN